jgi:hypothetical protein
MKSSRREIDSKGKAADRDDLGKPVRSITSTQLFIESPIVSGWI